MPQQNRQPSSALSATLWVALGAAAGLVAGVMLAERVGGSRKLMQKLSGLLRTVEDFTAEHADDTDETDDTDDIDTDLPRIDERVLAAFVQDPILSARNIEIDEPEPGVIVLTGRVPDEADVAHSVTIARGVPGVTHVENHVRVRTHPRPAPRTRSGA